MIKEATPDEIVAVVDGSEVVNAFDRDGLLLDSFPVLVKAAQRGCVCAIKKLFAQRKALRCRTGLERLLFEQIGHFLFWLGQAG